MVLGDGGTDENGGDAPFEYEHHEHYGPTSNGFSGQHGNDQQCTGDPFFDWCELDEAFKKQRHEALAQKVKELVAKMRWRRSKAFWSRKKKDEKEQRMNMRQMQRMRKSGNTMSTYFDWGSWIESRGENGDGPQESAKDEGNMHPHEQLL